MPSNTDDITRSTPRESTPKRWPVLRPHVVDLLDKLVDTPLTEVEHLMCGDLPDGSEIALLLRDLRSTLRRTVERCDYWAADNAARGL